MQAKLPVMRKGSNLIYCPKPASCVPTADMWAKHNALIAKRRQAVIAYQSQHQQTMPEPAKGNGWGLGLIAILGLLLHA
jgi:hypothetical protein